MATTQRDTELIRVKTDTKKKVQKLVSKKIVTSVQDFFTGAAEKELKKIKQ